MLRLLLERAQEFPLLSLVGLSVVVVELICLAATWSILRKSERRVVDVRGGSNLPSKVAGCLALTAVFASMLIAAVAVWTVEDARATVLSFRTDYSTRLKDQIAVFGVALFFAIPSWLAAIFTCSLAIGIRRGSARNPHTPSSVARHCLGQALLFFCLGVLPWVVGVLGYALQIEHSSSAVAALAPEDKQAPLWQGWQLARGILSSWSKASVVGASFAAIASIFTLLRALKRETPASSSQGSEKRSVIGSVACLAGAVLCVLLARPYRTENLTPWPEFVPGCWPAVPPKADTSEHRGTSVGNDSVTIRLQPMGSTGTWSEIPSCQLSLPHSERLTPYVWIEGQEIRVNGRQPSAEGLAEDLVTERTVANLVRSPASSRDYAWLWASPSVPGARIVPILGQLGEAGFTRINLGCGRVTVHRRPKLGTLARACPAAARVGLGLNREQTAGRTSSVARIAAARYATYGLLFGAVLAAGESGEPVRLDVSSGVE
jgi:hypothetical protein